jgi:hypothetical protein
MTRNQMIFCVFTPKKIAMQSQKDQLIFDPRNFDVR